MDRVIVTGASSGLGEEFARQLAAQGRGLVLTARREDRLLALADDLTQTYGVPADYVVCDLSRTQGAEDVFEAVKANGWAISGLVNNAGFGALGAFDEIPLQRQVDMLNVNVSSLVELTYRLLPLLKTQADGFIINTASTAAFQPGPGMAVYFASKAFVLSFSEALYDELKRDGISVSALCPGATETEFSKAANMESSRIFQRAVGDRRNVVKTALQRRKEAVVMPGLQNAALVKLSNIVPRALSRSLAKWFLD